MLTIPPYSLLVPGSVVIRYLDIKGVTVPPDETHAELIVDSNAVLAFPVTVQLFETVARRNSQVLDGKS
jgi:hypothetical protein